jgi:hypothetical protein
MYVTSQVSLGIGLEPEQPASVAVVSTTIILRTRIETTSRFRRGTQVIPVRVLSQHIMSVFFSLIIMNAFGILLHTTVLLFIKSTDSACPGLPLFAADCGASFFDFSGGSADRLVFRVVD